MPILKSAAKRMRSDAKKRSRNVEAKSELKTLYKKLADLSKAKASDAQEKARELVSLFDKATSRGVIPVSRANRKKARIANLLAKIK